MRRLLSIATLVLPLLAITALAQRGGGHASFGGHGGGFAAHGSFGGHFASGHARGGMRSGFAARGLNRGATFSRPAFSSRTFGRSSNQFNRFNRFSGPIIRNYAYGRGRFGSWTWPWWNAYYDPWWWWDSDSYSSYDPDYEQQLQIAQQMNEQSLEEQQMRRQQDADSYAQSAPQSQPSSEDTHTQSIVPPTVLIFRDQHQQEVQNYAIVGQTLWAFAPGRTQKIPLSDLDLPATTKANDDRGLDFKVPGSGEGQ